MIVPVGEASQCLEELSTLRLVGCRPLAVNVVEWMVLVDARTACIARSEPRPCGHRSTRLSTWGGEHAVLEESSRGPLRSVLGTITCSVTRCSHEREVTLATRGLAVHKDGSRALVPLAAIPPVPSAFSEGPELVWERRHDRSCNRSRLLLQDSSRSRICGARSGSLRDSLTHDRSHLYPDHAA